MSVEHVLDRIADHNAAVLGCIVTHNGQIFDNLPDIFELIDRAELAERAQNMFSLTEDLQDDPGAFDQVFLEFPEYALFARRMEDGVLVLVNAPIERAAFKKMQVGVNLFLKPLKKALAEAAPEPAGAGADGAAGGTFWQRLFGRPAH